MRAKLRVIERRGTHLVRETAYDFAAKTRDNGYVAIAAVGVRANGTLDAWCAGTHERDHLDLVGATSVLHGRIRGRYTRGEGFGG